MNHQYLKHGVVLFVALIPHLLPAQILQFTFVNATRAEDRVQDMMTHLLETAGRQSESTGDQLFYFISGLEESCEGYNIEDCRRCANYVQSNPPYSRDLTYHWEHASAMFNEKDFLKAGNMENADWKYNLIEWHFYYGGDDVSEAQEDKLFIDQLLRISGTKIEDPSNRIFLHVPEAYYSSTEEKKNSSPVFSKGLVSIITY